MRYSAAVALWLLGALGPSAAETAAEAYKKGCAGCHASENAVLRRIPPGDDESRRVWLQKFMAQHPCERGRLEASDHRLSRRSLAALSARTRTPRTEFRNLSMG
jgi:hypothetical protein